MMHVEIEIKSKAEARVAYSIFLKHSHDITKDDDEDREAYSGTREIMEPFMSELQDAWIDFEVTETK